MRHASLAALLVFALGLAAEEPPKTEAPPRRAARVLPGIQPDRSIRLPNQWSLRPAGRHLALGDFPVNLALHPSGDWLAALHAGHGEHEVIVVDLRNKDRERIASRVPLEQTFYGLCFSPDGKTLYASGGEFEVVHAFAFAAGLLSDPRTLRIVEEKETFVPAGLALDSEGKTLYAAGPWGDAVAVLPLDDPKKGKTLKLAKGSYPYACLPSGNGKRLFVSLWGGSGVSVIDLATLEVTATWKTASHPTEMALTPDGKTLFVSCANSTLVSVLDVESGRAVQTIACSLYPASPSGNTPSSLSLSPDGKLLFVANSDANNLALFNVEDVRRAVPLGFIPVGWYPTAVRFDAKKKRIYIANGKGLTSRPNPHGPGPYRFSEFGTVYQYIAGLHQGTLAVLDLPTPEKMEEYHRTALACTPLRKDFAPVGKRSEGNPIPAKVGDPSPIRHCIYIIKENRTYDQVFGDIPQGNGDPSLCLFGEEVTPNHHKLATEFVLLDNFYVESEVSADGHEWSMGAYATDFVEKSWPLVYRGNPRKKLTFPAEGTHDAIARPAGGYLWDRCAEAKVSYRSYGEWVDNGKTPEDPARARVKALEGHIDPLFRGYDLEYADVKRAGRFIAELKRFEKEGAMPQMQIVRLPNNHTSGTRVGALTPRAMVADNDLALGMVVEAVSKSKFWKDTAIFVVEDDAQNGPDHVDAHRTIALVVSPYTKRKYVDSTMYSTSSMLRTMELILGLKPMSQFDAAAQPMYNAFRAEPDLTPYAHVRPKVDLEEKNKATAWGADLSERLDLSREDAADDLLFNEIIWRSVKGADSPMPAPVRAAFIRPHVEEDEDD